MLIHAYRRKEPATVVLLGVKIEFKPNEHQHCVADVTHVEAAQRLLSITEGYRAYVDGDAAVASTSPMQDGGAADTSPPSSDPLVLVNEKGETLDLNKFTAKQVRAFAEQNGITLPASTSTPVAELRNALADALRGPVV